MKLLVINCGSSSAKYSLFEMDDESIIAEGLAERVAVGDGARAQLTHKVPGAESSTLARPMPDHSSAVGLIIEALTDSETGVIASVGEIGAIGHRVVHGAGIFPGSALITPETILGIEACAELAPLHNPPHLAGIRACQDHLPHAPQVAVFDTAFGQTMPPHAYHYAIPYELYEKHSIRRYGFHGTSHRYVSLVASRLLEDRDIPLAEQKLVTCHLGNGCSMTAVCGGECIDTSMGLTPLEGLVMGTRTGDIDPAAVWFIQEREGIDTDAVDSLMNKQSGLLGLSGVGSDMRDVRAAAASGSERAQLAIDVFCYRIRKYVGAYAAALGGLSAVVFTAGIGENTPSIRAQCIEGLTFLGLNIDPVANGSAVGGDEPHDISSPSSPARIFVIPTDEELMIARDTLELVT